MPAVLIAAPESLSGKTTIAAALGRRLSDSGATVALSRLAGDTNAAADARLLAGLAFNADRRPEPLQAPALSGDADVSLVEAPAGDPRGALKSLSARAVVVVAYADPLPAGVPSFCEALGDACVGVTITRVPVRRLEATRAAAGAIGVRLLGLIAEDRTLAAPTLGALAEALEADSSSLNSASETVMDRPVISSISADPAQGYFARYGPNAVIVRGDKPDQQLGALNAGAPCLIVTGGLPVLSYVEERAAEEGIPVLRTRYDTVAAVERLEALYGATPFSGRAKVERIAELAGELDISSLT
ncbi:MAG: DRTGG domain-containing protein [Dehalococcoidia bacterium]|nr:DRTGG domain-containing protein [Dehalococcoidia bacterium]